MDDNEPIAVSADKGAALAVATATAVIAGLLWHIDTMGLAWSLAVCGFGCALILCFSMRRSLRHLMITLCTVVAVISVVIAGWKWYAADAPNRAALAQQRVTYEEQISHKQAVIDSATAALAKDFDVYTVKIYDPNWNTGEASLNLTIAGEPVVGQVAIRLIDGKWVPGCSTIGGGMIPLVADNARLLLHFYASGNCPRGLPEATIPVVAP